jgi:hypothetical protein
MSGLVHSIRRMRCIPRSGGLEGMMARVVTDLSRLSRPASTPTRPTRSHSRILRGDAAGEAYGRVDPYD